MGEAEGAGAPLTVDGHKGGTETIICNRIDEGFYIVENPDATYAVYSPEKLHALCEPVLDTELRTVIERMYESMVKGEECIKG